MSDTDRLRQIEEMLRLNPYDSFLNYAAALEFKKRKDLAKATSLMEGIIERDPSYLGTYYQLAMIYIEQGAVAKAEELLFKGDVVARTAKDEKTISEINELLSSLQN